MAQYSFDRTRKDYAQRWDHMAIPASRLAQIDAMARKIIMHKGRYQAVAQDSGVPWAFIGVLHARESSCDFRGLLHNGERILGTGHKTRLVPKGRGPFTSWEEAARDALALKGFKPGAVVWSLARCLYEGERFNGFGYRMRGVPSAYLWSFSNQYSKGKYVADGKWSAAAVDRQIGIAPLMRRLMVLDPSISFDAPKAMDIGNVMVADGLSAAEIRSVQQRLRDLGYAETGMVDGIWGPRSMAGVAAFQATMQLPVTGRLDAHTAARLSTAGRRPVSVERAGLSARQLRQAGDEVARATAGARIAAMALGVPAVVIGVLDQIQDASSRLSGFAQLGDMPGWLMAVAVLAVAVTLYLLARSGENARLEAVRTGRDAGPA
ncbi:peptidoglycan-binding protein [Xanthobacter sp. TB0139]|uniref:peptidoglycan-binding protein n=1 Tax=Xanthobacter sp. TB0139 TaxID=3459178 RepID=UPI004039A7F4